jgi:hypothetical protein
VAFPQGLNTIHRPVSQIFDGKNNKKRAAKAALFVHFGASYSNFQ